MGRLDSMPLLRPAGTRLRIVVATLIAVLLATASAQVCRPELTAALLDGDLSRPATGIDAALVLQRAVTLVEPALPQLRRGGNIPLDSDHPAFTATKYLQDRKLLAPNWTPESIDGQSWNAMLTDFKAWYNLRDPQVDAPTTVADLIDDTATVLAEVSRAIRPAALLASDPANDDELSFWAIIWNWTVYPRLLVFKPQAVELNGNPRDVLPALGNCAVTVDRYISAPQDTAKSLFLTHNDSRMFVVASEPRGRAEWPYEVAAGSELEAFGFSLPALAGVRVFAAVFDGPDVGIGRVLGLMTSVRTNMSPVGFISHMQTP